MASLRQPWTAPHTHMTRADRDQQFDFPFVRTETFNPSILLRYASVRSIDSHLQVFSKYLARECVNSIIAIVIIFVIVRMSSYYIKKKILFSNHYDVTAVHVSFSIKKKGREGGRGREK